MHRNFLINVMRLPQMFFDTNPVGRIMSRFSKDIDTMDMALPRSLLDLSFMFFEVIAPLWVICYATPIFIAVLIPTMILYYFVQKTFIEFKELINNRLLYT
ncbi:hypothetical protein Avbf_03950 [Armadillidium vulgare]|nr:hypothetical protein Avbf_03950 [Armadillidium vulgare]